MNCSQCKAELDDNHVRITPQGGEAIFYCVSCSKPAIEEARALPPETKPHVDHRFGAKLTGSGSAKVEP